MQLHLYPNQNFLNIYLVTKTKYKNSLDDEAVTIFIRSSF